VKGKAPVTKKSGLTLTDSELDVEDMGPERMRAKLKKTYAMNDVTSSGTDMQDSNYCSQKLAVT
jgi:hypothetical protein